MPVTLLIQLSSVYDVPRQFSPEFIEKIFTGLCHSCGKAMPGKGFFGRELLKGRKTDQPLFG